jgi:hypothetical protein
MFLLTIDLDDTASVSRTTISRVSVASQDTAKTSTTKGKKVKQV